MPVTLCFLFPPLPVTPSLSSCHLPPPSPVCILFYLYVSFSPCIFPCLRSVPLHVVCFQYFHLLCPISVGVTSLLDLYVFLLSLVCPALTCMFRPLPYVLFLPLCGLALPCVTYLLLCVLPLPPYVISYLSVCMCGLPSVWCTCACVLPVSCTCPVSPVFVRHHHLCVLHS